MMRGIGQLFLNNAGYPRPYEVKSSSSSSPNPLEESLLGNQGVSPTDGPHHIIDIPRHIISGTTVANLLALENEHKDLTPELREVERRNEEMFNYFISRVTFTLLFCGAALISVNTLKLACNLVPFFVSMVVIAFVLSFVLEFLDLWGKIKRIRPGVIALNMSLKNLATRAESLLREVVLNVDQPHFEVRQDEASRVGQPGQEGNEGRDRPEMLEEQERVGETSNVQRQQRERKPPLKVQEDEGSERRDGRVMQEMVSETSNLQRQQREGKDLLKVQEKEVSGEQQREEKAPLGVQEKEVSGEQQREGKALLKVQGEEVSGEQQREGKDLLEVQQREGKAPLGEQKEELSGEQQKEGKAEERSGEQRDRQPATAVNCNAIDKDDLEDRLSVIIQSADNINPKRFYWKLLISTSICVLVHGVLLFYSVVRTYCESTDACKES